MVFSGQQIIFKAAFLSKLTFGVLFFAGSFLLRDEIIKYNLIKICGGESWYIQGSFDQRAWDSEVVDCIYNVRGGLFSAGGCFLVFSIILEEPREKKVFGNEFMQMLHAIGGLCLFGSVVSEMDIMKRVSSSAAILNFRDYARYFVIDYPVISNALWIIGALITTLGQAYIGYLRMQTSLLACSIYAVAAFGSFLFFIAGILRVPNVSKDLFPIGFKVHVSPQYQTYGTQWAHIDVIISSIIMAGSIFFILHALMYYFILYDVDVVDKNTQNDELLAIPLNDEESNHENVPHTEMQQHKDLVKESLLEEEA